MRYGLFVAVIIPASRTVIVPKVLQSIERGMAILEIIAQEGGAVHLRDIAEKAQLGKTTAHNILKTMETLGYLRRHVGDTRYHLGGRILNLARIAGDDGLLQERLRPALESIARKTGESLYLAVPSGDEILYLDAIASPEARSMDSPVGARDKLEGSAIGSVFLALMPGLGRRVRATRADAFVPDTITAIEEVAGRGFGLDIEAREPGVNCVAVPWREKGEVRACIGLSGPALRLPSDRLADLAWLMMRELERVR